MFTDPIAYFLTFTVRGSWRHGDDRGAWQHRGLFVPPGLNVGMKPNGQPVHLFSLDEQKIVENAFTEVCRERQWALHEKSVRSNHVHIVLTANDVSPETAMKLLKAKATMRLRQRGCFGEHEKIWTQHGSTKYLFDEKGFQTACEYVRNQ